MTKNILVTGANGFIGSHIVDSLLEHNQNVYCLVRKSSNLQWLNTKNVNLVYGSLDDLSGIENLNINFDSVIHSAGIVQAKKKEDFTEVNVKGTQNLIELFKKRNLQKFVFISSLTAAGPARKDHPKSEQSEDKPITAYGKSKLEAEKVILASGLDYIILRPGAVFGPRDKAMYSVFKMAQKGIFVGVGSNSKYVSMIDGEELAKISTDLTLSESIKNEIINCAYPEPIDLDHFNETIKITMNKKGINLKLPEKLVHSIGYINEYFSSILGISSVFDRDKAKDLSQDFWTADVSKLQNLLNWKPKRNLKQNIQRTLEWYKENRWL